MTNSHHETEGRVAPGAADVGIPDVCTAERWAWDYIHETNIFAKLGTGELPVAWEAVPPARRVPMPGRSPELRIASRAQKTPGSDAIRAPARRAELVHRFLHHEVQAAELMCWALLAFPETPSSFRRGLIRIACDEVRHAALYRDYLQGLGFDYGDFPVRDWFWARVPSAPTAAHFVAVMGMGFEGGNLDHTVRFAEKFRAIGDMRGAEIQEQVRLEEIAHVRFAVRWFETWTSGPDAEHFERWVDHLPAPLSPWVMRGEPMNRFDRRLSGFSDGFLDKLSQWCVESPGS